MVDYCCSCNVYFPSQLGRSSFVCQTLYEDDMMIILFIVWLNVIVLVASE